MAPLSNLAIAETHISSLRHIVSNVPLLQLFLSKHGSIKALQKALTKLHGKGDHVRFVALEALRTALRAIYTSFPFELNKRIDSFLIIKMVDIIMHLGLSEQFIHPKMEICLLHAVFHAALGLLPFHDRSKRLRAFDQLQDLLKSPNWSEAVDAERDQISQHIEEEYSAILNYTVAELENLQADPGILTQSFPNLMTVRSVRVHIHHYRADISECLPPLNEPSVHIHLEESDEDDDQNINGLSNDRRGEIDETDTPRRRNQRRKKYAVQDPVHDDEHEETRGRHQTRSRGKTGKKRGNTSRRYTQREPQYEGIEARHGDSFQEDSEDEDDAPPPTNQRLISEIRQSPNSRNSRVAKRKQREHNQDDAIRNVDAHAEGLSSSEDSESEARRSPEGRKRGREDEHYMSPQSDASADENGDGVRAVMKCARADRNSRKRPRTQLMQRDLDEMNILSSEDFYADSPGSSNTDRYGPARGGNQETIDSGTRYKRAKRLSHVTPDTAGRKKNSRSRDAHEASPRDDEPNLDMIDGDEGAAFRELQTKAHHLAYGSGGSDVLDESLTQARKAKKGTQSRRPRYSGRVSGGRPASPIPDSEPRSQPKRRRRKRVVLEGGSGDRQTRRHESSRPESSTQPARLKKYKRFQPFEDEIIKNGLKTHGWGTWTQISEDFEEKGFYRSALSLKDRARTLRLDPRDFPTSYTRRGKPNRVLEDKLHDDEMDEDIDEDIDEDDNHSAYTGRNPNNDPGSRVQEIPNDTTGTTTGANELPSDHEANGDENENTEPPENGAVLPNGGENNQINGDPSNVTPLEKGVGRNMRNTGDISEPLAQGGGGGAGAASASREEDENVENSTADRGADVEDAGNGDENGVENMDQNAESVEGREENTNGTEKGNENRENIALRADGSVVDA